MADVENYQQRFLDLVKIFDSEPESHNKLYSNSHFRDDVRCRCGWSLKLNIKNCYRALHDTKKHYEKRVSPLSTARAFRQYDEKHLLFGFYLKENTIIKLPKPSSVLRWTSPRHTINPPNIPPPTPSPSVLARVVPSRFGPFSPINIIEMTLRLALVACL